MRVFVDEVVRRPDVPDRAVHPESDIHILDRDLLGDDVVLVQQELVQRRRTPGVGRLDDVQVQRCVVVDIQQVVVAVAADEILVGNAFIVRPVRNLKRVALRARPDRVPLGG